MGSDSQTHYEKTVGPALSGVAASLCADVSSFPRREASSWARSRAAAAAAAVRRANSSSSSSDSRRASARTRDPPLATANDASAAT